MIQVRRSKLTSVEIVSRGSRVLTTNYRPSLEATVPKDGSLATRGLVFDRIAWTSQVITLDKLVFDLNGWVLQYRSTKPPFIDALWGEPHSRVRQPFNKVEE